MDGYEAALRADLCAFCGRAGGSLDRIVPGHRGGSYCWMNVTGICRSCNSAKGTRSVLGHMLRRLADPEFARRCREAVATGSIFRIIAVHGEVADERRLLAGVGR